MGISKRAIVVLAGLLVGSEAQSLLAEVGWGITPEHDIYQRAAENPLNKTTVNFQGFNFLTDPGSDDNASSRNGWSWNAALSIINTENNETNYPLSLAANSASNILNVAYTLDFPGDYFPAPNYTNWTTCAHIIDVDWTDDVLRRALNDPGDCSIVLGESCLNEASQAWRKPSNSTDIGCPEVVNLDRISECGSLINRASGVYSAPISSIHADATDGNSPYVGLRSGQVFGYETSKPFNRTSAQDSYDRYASTLRMMVLNFAPSEAYDASHPGTVNPGEVRTFCSIMNKNLDPVKWNAAAALTPLRAVKSLMMIWSLVFIGNLV